MSEKLIFQVKGTEGNYTVTFSREGTNLTTTCTCPAREHEMHCKHRIALMWGDPSAIISKNKEDVKKVLEMVKGSDVEEILGDVLRIEKQLEQLQEELTKKKKKLARKMHD
jgi:uncharacterized Zn finger protein